jgi:hypothetical protein
MLKSAPVFATAQYIQSRDLMTTLTTPLRKQLEKVIRQARDAAEEAAADAIRRAAVSDAEAPTRMNEAERALRRRLRAHARSLGDTIDEKRVLTTRHLQEATAYEIWHRMLFGRFLVERGLLIHPELRAALTLDELSELAFDEGATDAWVLAERYAAATLPAVFKPEDPVLAMPLDAHHHKRLQALVIGLDRAVFDADDALGWTYQFWRAAEKDAVNAAGIKIGADELPAVTQLFTEPYMVKSVLHNTLGAWWAGRLLARRPDVARTARNEEELRRFCALPGVAWEFLRFVREPDENGLWRPAAGTYPGWPLEAAAIKFLDPCCGSGHFLVEALSIMTSLLQAENGLSAEEAVQAVLRKNLQGLEIDGRCVQIAAFAVALTAWRLAGGPISLPNPRIAWVGASPLSRSEMVTLANRDITLQPTLQALNDQFAQAPLLGTLLEVSPGDLLDADWRERLEEALDAMVEHARTSEPEHAEGAVAALGLLGAVELISQRYTLQITNVPFLGRSAQTEDLAKHCERRFPDAKSDLATVMMSRMIGLSAQGGTIAAVTPQNWLFLTSYRALRERLLGSITLNSIAGLGSRAFETISGEIVNVALVTFTNAPPNGSVRFIGLDANDAATVDEKIEVLRSAIPSTPSQQEQKANADARISLKGFVVGKLLNRLAYSYQGLSTGENPRFRRAFWEVMDWRGLWEPEQSTVEGTTEYGGRSGIILWEHGAGRLAAFGRENVATLHNVDRRGEPAWGKQGVGISQMGNLPATLFGGEKFDTNTAVIIPHDPKHLPAIWAFCSSVEYRVAVRTLDRNLKVTNSTLVKVPFDVDRWTQVASERYPSGLPEPYSHDPTQWLFHGHPAFASEGTEVHVALARLAGYRWPVEINRGMRLDPAMRDLVRKAADLAGGDSDGILPLHSLGSSPSLADRLRALLSSAFGSDWSNAKEVELVRSADGLLDKKVARDATLEAWLRDRAFRQHCKLFQDRPFIWQVTDGLRDGFSAFLHYHRLDRAKLEKITYAVLGDWLNRANAENNVARIEKGGILQQALKSIATGEKPFDIFVRWKAPEQQPLGWEPDLDDGIRLNIRPFVMAGILRDKPNIRWSKDRGTDLPSAPWFSLFNGARINDHHTTLAEKQAARAAACKFIQGVA